MAWSLFFLSSSSWRKGLLKNGVSFSGVLKCLYPSRRENYYYNSNYGGRSLLSQLPNLRAAAAAYIIEHIRDLKSHNATTIL